MSLGTPTISEELIKGLSFSVCLFSLDKLYMGIGNGKI